MTESLLRKITVLLVISNVVCILWALGANSRKHVELEKSSSLQTKIQTLSRANTVITDNLKQANNRMFSLKKAEQELHNLIAALEDKNKALNQNLATSQEDQNDTDKEFNALKKDAENLKNANMLLGEELIKLKEKEAALQQELLTMKTALESHKTSRVPEKTETAKPAQEKPVTEQDKDKNFRW